MVLSHEVIYRYIVCQVDMISGRYTVCPYSKVLSGWYDLWSL